MSSLVMAIGVACSSSDSVAPLDEAKAKGSTVAGSGQDSTGGSTTNPPPTSTGPVASVKVFPQTVALPLERYSAIAGVPLDKNGVRVANRKVTWKSSNPDIVAVMDTGVVYGKALGTAKVYASLDGFIDSSIVTVVPRSETSTPTPLPQAAVASFDLTAQVRGSLGAVDTSLSQAVAGATVKLTRVMTAKGDTLTAGEPAGSAVTDAQGNVSFKKLTGGAYRVEITPPADSPYAALSSGFGPPLVSDFRALFVVRRK